MPVDRNAAPALHAILRHHSPKAGRPGQRVIGFDIEGEVDQGLLVEAAAELSDAGIGDRLTAQEVAAIAAVAGKWSSIGVPKVQEIVGRVRELVDRRWSEISAPVARLMIAESSHRSSIRACLPRLETAGALVEAVIAMLGAKESVHLGIATDVRELRIEDPDQIRRALRLTDGQHDPHLNLLLIGAAVRAQGWTPWLKLRMILGEFIELAGDGDVDQPAVPDRFTSSDHPAEIRRDAWTNIVDDEHVRTVAQLIVDLDGALAYSAPDIRGVYVRRLRDALGDDAELRAATIETLLMRPHDRQQDLGLYAATALTRPEDEPLITALTGWPDRGLGYRAALLHEAVFGGPEPESSWPRPTLTGIAEGLFQLRLEASAQEQSRTWLGDRLLERMIEHTAASEEERFAREFHLHSESDEEEGLLRLLFRISRASSPSSTRPCSRPREPAGSTGAPASAWTTARRVSPRRASRASARQATPRTLRRSSPPTSASS